MAKEFLRTQETLFSNRQQTIATDYISYGSAGFAFAQYTPYWKFMKKLCVSELLGGRTLDRLLPIRRDEMKRFLYLMLKRANENEAVDIEGELLRLTNNVITRMTMGKRCSEDENEAEEIRELVKATAELTGEFNLSDCIWFLKNLDFQGFWKRLKDFRYKFDVIMDRVMEEHQEARREENGRSGQVKDLLDLLLDISEDENQEIRLTRENIKAFILVCFQSFFPGYYLQMIHIAKFLHNFYS